MNRDKREIKFRLICENLMGVQFIIYRTLGQLYNGLQSSGVQNILHENEWTGLKDKNGIDIYDSDKVKRRVHLAEGEDFMDYNCTIKWNGWCYGVFIHDKQLWGLDPITAREIEVTGNIYENGK